MRRPTERGDRESLRPQRGEELAAPSSTRQGPLDRPAADEHLRATQPLPAARPMEAGEAVPHRDAGSGQHPRDRQLAGDGREGLDRERHDGERLDRQPRDGERPHAEPGEPVRAAAGGQFLSGRDQDLFRQRWIQVQAGFVDSPLAAAKEADQLIGDVLERVTRGLGVERETLAARWRAGSGEPDTEDLRLAIQGYRALFERLLGA